MDLFTNTTISTVTESAVKMVLQEQLLAFIFNKFNLLSLGNVALLILLIIIEPLRDAIKEPIKNECNNFIKFLLYCKDVTYDLFVLSYDRPKSIINKKTNNVVVKYDKNFIVALHNWMKKNTDSVEYTEKLTNINMTFKNNNSVSKIIEVSSIKINKIWYDVDLTFTISVDKNNNIIEQSCPIIYNLSDILPQQIKDHLNIVINNNDVNNIKSKLLMCSETKHMSFCMALYTMMKKKYPNLLLDTFLFEYVVLAMSDKFLTDWKKIVVNSNELIFDKYNVYSKDELNEAYNSNWYTMTNFMLPHININQNLNIYQILLENKLNNSNTFNILSTTNSNIVSELTNEIYFEQSNDSRIFSIGVKKVIKNKTIVPNVEYDKWMKKKTIVTSRDYSTAMSDFIKMKVPDETVEVVEYETVLDIVTQDVVSKHIDTLYLNKDDKNKLMTLLSQFRDNKELYTQLGSPYQMNLFLHGNPGCGKTHCIQTIATFLKRDIYCINLINVETVDDLNMILNHIRANTWKPGIIVFENVDNDNIFLKNEYVIDDSISEDNNSDSVSTKSKKSNDDKTDDDKKETKSEKLVNIIEKLTLKHIMDRIYGLLSWEGSVCIMTTNNKYMINESVYNSGCFNQIIHFDWVSVDQMNEIYKFNFKKEVSDVIFVKKNQMSVQKFINEMGNYKDFIE